MTAWTTTSSSACEAGYTDDELTDALNVALVVGGSIVIPHLRHAMETIDLLRAQANQA